MIKPISRELRERSAILIEQHANGKFYVTKNRFSNKYNSPNDEIHPNEVVKLLATAPDVVVVNRRSLTPHIQWYNPYDEIAQPWELDEWEEVEE